METLDYNRLLLVSLWQYNHHGDEGLTPALFEETFGKVYGLSLIHISEPTRP